MATRQRTSKPRVTLEPEVYEVLQGKARASGVPVTKLVNDVIRQSFSEREADAAGGSSRSSMRAAVAYLTLGGAGRKEWFEQELAKADSSEHQAMAEEGMAEDMKTWPPY